MKRYWLLLIITISLFCTVDMPATSAQADQLAPDYPVISPENVSQIEQLKVFGEGLVHDVIFSPDEQYVAMPSSVGIWLYSVDDFTTPIRLFGNYEIDITDAIFNADGTQLFGGIYGGSVYVWDVASGELLFELHPPRNRYNINELRLSDDEQNLYVISSYLDIWNLNAHQLEQNFDLDTISDNKPVLSPNEQYILTHRNGGENYDGENFYFVPSTTTVLSVETGLPLYELREEHLYIYNPQFDETSSKIVGILDYANWAIGIWDVQSGDLLHIVGDNMLGYKETPTYAKPHEQSSSSLTHAILSKDQSKAIFFYYWGGVSVWDIATNTELREYAFSIENTAYENNPFNPYDAIYFDDSSNEEIIKTFIEEEEILYKTPFHLETRDFDSSIVISPKRTFFVSTPYGGYIPLYVWRIETGEVVFRIAVDENCYVGNGGIYGFSQLSLQNSRIVHYVKHNVCIWDVETEELVNKIPTTESFRFSQTPYLLDTQHFVTFNSFLSEVLIWNLETNTSIPTSLNQEGQFTITGFSSDGKYLVTIFGRIASVWDTTTGDLVNQIEITEVCCPENLLFSPDSGHIVIAGPQSPVDGYARVIIWNQVENTITIPDLGHWGLITGLEFSPDSNYLLSLGHGHVKLLDLRTDKLRDRLYTYSRVNATFSPDGSYFAVSHNNGFDIIETETGDMMYSFGIGNVSRLDFSPSGDILMVVQGKTIQFWDIFALENLYTIHAPSIIESAKFNDDGNLIITEMRDGTIRLWGVPTP
ncbi:MAG: hypothetical protein SFZ02_18055 [bacterium]|nr:hypothetical protein [bacterium]